MHPSIRKHWPLYCTLAAFWITALVLIARSINLNAGHLVYALDDTYIHMSIAKNAVLHHVWGPTKYEFTSSTSSPLWTMLLTLSYLVFGASEKAPLLLNLIAGTLAILAAYFFISKYIQDRLRIFLVLLAAVIVAPLPSLTLIAMEHLLHVTLTVCFVFLAAKVLSQNPKPIRREHLLLLLLALAPFIATIRYEGLFAVFAVCTLLLLKRRPLHAVYLGAAAALPVMLYGIWSIAHGWYFLPNSLILKAAMLRSGFNGIITALGSGALQSIQADAQILILLTAALSLLLIRHAMKKSAQNEITYANLIFIAALLLHMQFACKYQFFRYDAYLVFLGIIVIGISANSVLPKKISWNFDSKTIQFAAVSMCLLFVVANPFVSRAAGSLRMAPQAAKNIYEQQYQMATFLKRFYQGKAIALNDIGVATFMADIQLVDLWGLGSLESARLKLLGTYGAQQIDNWTRERDVKIAMAYDCWFENESKGGLPKQWIRVGQWRIANNVICGSDIVSIFAVDPAEHDTLLQNLRQFAAELPADVLQLGEYTLR